MSSADEDLAPGTVVSDRYRVDERIGQGAMGAVYRATHVHMRKRVALKVLLPELSGREDIVARFEREAMAAAHIDHPNVVAATDFGRLPSGAFFLVLEYIEGRSLREAIASERRFAPRRAARIGAQIASALARAHGLGIVHRDLKPDNVMLVRRDGSGTAAGAVPTSAPEPETVKVLDFGIAKVTAGMTADGGKVLTQIGAVFGTPEYMAPEQAMGESVDGRADLYALGATLYEMVSGQRPFEAESPIALLTMHVSQAPVPISVRAPEVSVPPELESLIMRLLAKKRDDRPATAEEVASALTAIASAAVEQGPAATAPPIAGGAAVEARTQADVARAATVQSDPLLSLAQRAPLAKGPGVPGPRVDPRRRALVAAAGAILLLLVVWLSLRPTHGPRPHTAGGVDAGAAEGSWLKALAPKLSDARIKAAAKSGPAALVALEREFPDDPRVPRELVRAFMAEGKQAEAMAALGRLVRLDAAAVGDEEVSRAMDTLLDSTEPDVADGALALLEGPLGARGVDLLIEKLDAAKPGPARLRYQRSLKRPEVRAHASPAAAILLDLRDAKTCLDRRALLPRAETDGDARALAVLTTYRRTRGCGFLGTADCFACMRGTRQLEDAIATLSARR